MHSECHAFPQVCDAARNFDRAIHLPPKPHNMRIRRAPQVHKRLKFLFLHAGFNCAHGNESADRTAVATAQNRLLAFLTKFRILTMLFHLAVKHARCRFAVNISILSEHIQYPSFACKPCKNPRFNCRVVRNDETRSSARNKRRANQL